MDPAATRRPCFLEEDPGLASLVDIEAGFSGNHNNTSNHTFLSRSLSRKASFRNNLFICSPRSISARLYDSRFEDQQPHFLNSCFLCNKPLAHNRDIFMYNRGDTPFCSEECRQEQMEVDEAKEKKWNISSSLMKGSREKEQRKSSSSNKGYSLCIGTIAAA